MKEKKREWTLERHSAGVERNLKKGEKIKCEKTSTTGDKEITV